MKKKKHRITLPCILLLTMFTAYVLLDTFVIERTYTEAVVQAAEVTEPLTETEIGTEVETEIGAETETEIKTEVETEQSQAVTSASETQEDGLPAEAAVASETQEDGLPAETAVASEDTDASSAPVITENSYQDENMQITVTEYVAYDTSIYVADVRVSSAEYLKTAFANNSYGKNIKDTTSAIAESNQAILAINGDFYGSRNAGYVLRNGTIYREEATSGQEDLVIASDGSFSIIDEAETSLEEIAESGAWQVFSFGPAIVEDGLVAVSEEEEVGKAMASNPRTAIGIIDDLHYVFVVSDGRTSESEGLSLSQLAEVMRALGCTTAYNLDGGGSSTMYFNGQIINNPTTNGHTIKERSVSDIVYIG